MRFKDIELYKLSKTSEDELGNEINEPKLIIKTKGRFTQWTKDDVELEGREVTTSQRRILTMANLSDCSNAKIVKIDGIDYEVIKVVEYGRWRCIYVKVYKHDYQIS